MKHLTEAEFDSFVAENPNVAIDFYADWCGPCRMIAPIWEKLEGEYSEKVKLVKVNVDENPGLARKFQVSSIPALKFLKEGKVVDDVLGALPEPALRQKLDAQYA